MRIVTKLGAVVVLASVAAFVVGSQAKEAGPTAADAQRKRSQESGVAIGRELLESIPEASRASTVFSFESPERTNWNFVPMSRAGFALADMSSHQRDLVDALLASALSERGQATARNIIDHESLLGALEKSRNVFNWRRRDSGLYYTTLFGSPQPDETWAWRFEGHHLSVNVTHVAGQTQVVAPLFMGANPARVPEGPKAGLRLLAAEEDTARALLQMLATERRARAIISERAFDDIVTRNDPKVKSIAFEGLAAADMSRAEQAQLRKLLNVYAGRMTPAAAKEQLDRIESAGFGKLRFAWAGSAQPREPHYYRVHGPTVLIEYDNTQNDANHAHTVWRDLERDFGGDALRAHYAKHHHERSARAAHRH